IVVRWTISNSPCTASMADVTITINQPPTTATAGGSQTICTLGTTTGLGGNTSTTGTGAWSVVSGGTGTFVPNASTPSASFTQTSGTGPIVLRWTISHSPCTASTADVTITVNVAPTDITLSNSSIAENSGASAVVGTLSATDPDSGETFTFSLPAGLDDNNLFNISSTSLRENASFDFETQNSYTVTVRVADHCGVTFDKQFVISISNVNDAPVAVDDTGTTTEDVAVSFTQDDLKGNDTDVDNSNAQLSVTAVSNPSNGSVVLNLDGTVTFSPDLNFNGTAGFDYTLSDGSLTDIGHVTITVTAVNDAPVALADTGTTAEDTAISFPASGA